MKFTDKEVMNAIDGAIASKGKNKGKLKAKCPPVNTPEAAAWQAIISHANPYKIGMAHLMFMSPENRELYNIIDNTIKANNIDVRSMDVDRIKLELLKAW